MDHRLGRNHLFVLPIIFLFASTATWAGTGATKVSPKFAGRSLGSPPGKSRHESVVLRLIDSKGRVTSFGQVKKLEWIWRNIEVNGQTVEAPALRLTAANPFSKDLVMEEITGDSATVYEKTVDTIIIDVTSLHPELHIRLRDRQNKVDEMTILPLIMLPKTHVAILPRCVGQGLTLETSGTRTGPLFMGLSCNNNGNTIDAYLIRSEDSSWVAARQSNGQNVGPVLIHRESKLQPGTTYPKRLLKADIADSEGHVSQYAVSYSPEPTKSRFSFSAELGLSLYSYQENIIEGKTLSETAISGKGSASYMLVPKRFDLGLSAFATLLPLTVYPSGLGSVRFLGINGRVGYHVPVKWADLDYIVLPGYYFWSMSINGSPDAFTDYGVEQMAGPQVVFQIADHRSGHRSWSTYLKLALISPGLNGEVAVGVGYELSKASNKPWTLTLDFARTSFSSDAVSMALTSATVGIRKTL